MITGQHPADGVLTTPCCLWFRAYEVVSVGVFRFVPKPTAFDAAKTYIYDIAWGPDYATGVVITGALPTGLTNTPVYNATVGCLEGYIGRTPEGACRAVVVKAAGTTNITDSFVATSRNATVTFAYDVVNADGLVLDTIQPDVSCGIADARKQSILTAFGGGRFYPAGNYTVGYLDGAVKYGAADGYRLNSPRTWVSRAVSRDWVGVASDYTGQKLAAVGDSFNIYTSSDAGETWTSRDSSRVWSGVASSYDGVKLAATVNGGQIYTSADSGVTWTPRESNRTWFAVASNVLGTVLVAASQGSTLYVSTDSGVNWTSRGIVANHMSVAIGGASVNGTYMIAGANGQQLQVSDDTGITWVARDAVRIWRACCLSRDGSRMYAADQGGRIYLSVDFGVTWTAYGPTGEWTSLACDTSGMRVVAAQFTNDAYESVDGGLTWTQLVGFADSICVTSNADMTRWLFGTYGGVLHTSDIVSAKGYRVWSARERNHTILGSDLFPALGGTYATQALCEAGNVGKSWPLAHKGGPIGLTFEAPDYSVISADQRPRFKLSHVSVLQPADTLLLSPTGSITYFGHGKSYPAGSYKIVFLRGGYRYLSSEGWRVLAAGTSLYVRKGAANVLIAPPLLSFAALPTLYDVAAQKEGTLATSFAWTGGQLGMLLFASSSTYQKIIPGNPVPEFQLVPF